MKALLFSLLLAPALLAQPAGRPGSGPRPHRGPAQGAACPLADLSAPQKEQVKALHAKHREALKAKMDAARQARTALHEALAKADTPEATLRQLHEQVSRAQFDVMLEHRALRQEVDQLLTPEQKAKRDALFEKMKARREKMRGRAMGPHGMGPHGMGPLGEGCPEAPKP